VITFDPTRPSVWPKPLLSCIVTIVSVHITYQSIRNVLTEAATLTWKAT